MKGFLRVQLKEKEYWQDHTTDTVSHILQAVSLETKKQNYRSRQSNLRYQKGKTGLKSEMSVSTLNGGWTEDSVPCPQASAAVSCLETLESTLCTHTLILYDP
jgi:hypothetical protein